MSDDELRRLLRMQGEAVLAAWFELGALVAEAAWDDVERAIWPDIEAALNEA